MGVPVKLSPFCLCLLWLLKAELNRRLQIIFGRTCVKSRHTRMGQTTIITLSTSNCYINNLICEKYDDMKVIWYWPIGPPFCVLVVFLSLLAWVGSSGMCSSSVVWVVSTPIAWLMSPWLAFINTYETISYSLLKHKWLQARKCIGYVTLVVFYDHVFLTPPLWYHFHIYKHVFFWDIHTFRVLWRTCRSWMPVISLSWLISIWFWKRQTSCFSFHNYIASILKILVCDNKTHLSN